MVCSKNAYVRTMFRTISTHAFSTGFSLQGALCKAHVAGVVTWP